MKYLSLLLLSINLFAIDPEESQLLSLINAYRAQNGAPALVISESLQHSSRWFSYDLGRTGSFSHIDSLGRSPSTRMLAFGYPTVVTGENIHGGSKAAQDAFNAFRDACDPGPTGACTYAHRINMLNPIWVVVGIGRAYVPESLYKYYWTTDFGYQMSDGSTPPVTIPPVTPPPATPPSNPPTPPPPPPPTNNPCSSAPLLSDCYSFSATAGDYSIRIDSPYGLRVYLDGVIILERWRDMPPYSYNLRRNLSSGGHVIVVEHYNLTNPQKITVTWTKL